jgi:uncharacterized protein (DUF433 family)
MVSVRGIVASKVRDGVHSFNEAGDHPEVMSGAAVFTGTRVPVQTLIEYLEAGDSIDEFLEGFPSVSRAQVIAFLEQAKDRLVESVS